MNAQSRPRFDREKLAFFREENAQYASAISPGDPNRALHVLNPTVMQVAELCDGERTVQVIRELFVQQHQHPKSSPLSKYVDEALVLLGLYNLVTFDLENPPTPTDGLRIRRLEEWDLSNLRALIVGGEFPLMESVPVLHYRHPYGPPDMYAELPLRLRIFQQQEFFLAMTRGDEVTFVVGFLDERPLKPNATISLIAGKAEQELAPSLHAVFEGVTEELSGYFGKLTWRCVCTSDMQSPLRAALEDLGFRREATLRDELGPGRDEQIYAYFLRHEEADSAPEAADPPPDCIHVDPSGHGLVATEEEGTSGSAEDTRSCSTEAAPLPAVAQDPLLVVNEDLEDHHDTLHSENTTGEMSEVRIKGQDQSD